VTGQPRTSGRRAGQPAPARRGQVIPLHPARVDDDGAVDGAVDDGVFALAAAAAGAALELHLGRSALAPATVRAYRRQARAHLAWLAEHATEHPDASAGAWAQPEELTWRPLRRCATTASSWAW